MSDSQLYLRSKSSSSQDTEQDFFSKASEPQYICKGFMSTRVYNDLPNIILLICLYMIQGIPMGLAFGSVPFLLQQYVSYTDLGIFSLVGYPYSLKLLWAPIVDTIYSPFIGRRKSWIIPVQLFSGLLMFWMSLRMDELMNPKTLNVYTLSFLFFILILFAATQDIAVDGWALTILSKENTSLAATCQTIGLNIGYFSSFTIFLAFNSIDFCNTYIRSNPQDYPLIELGGYLQFWSIIYLLFTFYLIVFKTEKKEESQISSSLSYAYKQTLQLALRPHVYKFLLALSLCKFGFIVAETVTALELIARGFKKEDLALFVLLDFPLQIGNAIFAGKVAKTGNFNGWLLGYLIRLAVSFTATFVVFIYPTSDSIPIWYFLLVLIFSLAFSTNSTFMFVAMGGFFTQISDSSIGGTYLTLLNTVSNLGGTWPKFPLLYLVDFFSIAHCEADDGNLIESIDCLANNGKSACELLNGTCINDVEGYYIVNILSIIIGLILFFYVRKILKTTENIDFNDWKVNNSDQVDLSGKNINKSFFRLRCTINTCKKTKQR